MSSGSPPNFSLMRAGRLIFHKLAASGRIEGHVTLFGSAATDVKFQDLRFALGTTMFLAEHPGAEESRSVASTAFAAAYELTRVSRAGPLRHAP